MKINDQFNKNIEQTVNITRLTAFARANIENVKLANSFRQYIKEVSDLSSDWVILEMIVDEVFGSSARVISYNFSYEWQIDLSFLPEYLIPYLNIKILYDSSEDLLQRNFDTDIFDDNNITVKSTYVIQSDDSIGSVPAFTLIASIFVNQRVDGNDGSKDLNVEDIKARLLLSIQNPNDYV